ncbi:hypothetical protein FNF29_02430 [Cafeteria roenbergensis]|uniref:Metallo-beta-lactamase domain-containing protein n=1 Tax=Cafeteria roenbergensis TaxID=33653 RepID=A0A5A8CN61_CAFRO|nr:hypothetical protein FNF29_02430 [Cafeteria roenbergensis]KAA0168061.1 hypothetical protein FNF31_00560 [Cafeteria roenbergensis]|eukprot:KAA0154553.1 hypothetical protein FNF29_02430 [Cafeteria roenbergensis]
MSGPARLTVFGTAAQAPSRSRNVSATGIQWPSGAAWLVDCGEGTQHRARAAKSFRLSRLDAIFLTHLHGDHVFGLPGLLCSAGQQRKDGPAKAPEPKRSKLGKGAAAAKGEWAPDADGGVDADDEATLGPARGERQCWLQADGALVVEGVPSNAPSADDNEPLRVVGLEGTASTVLTALQLSYSFVRRPLELIELVPRGGGGGGGAASPWVSAWSTEGACRAAGVAADGAGASAAASDAAAVPAWAATAAAAAAAEAGTAGRLDGEGGWGKAGIRRLWKPQLPALASVEGLSVILGVPQDMLPPAMPSAAVAAGRPQPRKAPASEPAPRRAAVSPLANPVSPRVTVRRVLQDADGAWRPFVDDNATAVAVPLEHSVPCVGWVFTEPPKPGRLCIEAVRPVLRRNKEALAASGVRVPESLLRDLKRGDRVSLPDGTVLDPADPAVIAPASQGRRLAVFGDTCAPSLAALRESFGADVLVHEATNALTPADGPVGDAASQRAAYGAVRAKAVSHGHSTPQMGGAFARAADAGLLVLSHFSARYKGGAAPEDVAEMAVLAEQARRMMDAAEGDVDAAALIPAAPAGAAAAAADALPAFVHPPPERVSVTAAAAPRAAVSGAVVAAFDMMTVMLGFKRTGDGPRNGRVMAELSFDASVEGDEKHGGCL